MIQTTRYRMTMKEKNEACRFWARGSSSILLLTYGHSWPLPSASLLCISCCCCARRDAFIRQHTKKETVRKRKIQRFSRARAITSSRNARCRSLAENSYTVRVHSTVPYSRLVVQYVRSTTTVLYSTSSTLQYCTIRLTEVHYSLVK